MDAPLFRLLDYEELGEGPVSRVSDQDRLKAQIWAPEVFQVQMKAHYYPLRIMVLGDIAGCFFSLQMGREGPTRPA